MTMQRIVEEELLDTDQGSPEEVAAALRSISLVNRCFGGVALQSRLLGTALERMTERATRASILEVASGHAEVLQSALLRLGSAAEVTLLDRQASHLPEPSTWSRVLRPPTRMQGDALELPFADRSVDIVSCCLFVHHLEPTQVMRFLAEAYRVARVAVVINDLERSPVHYRLAKLYRWIDRSRISRYDGPVSVRRAYTYRELARMLKNTGHPFQLQRAFLYRLGAVLWRQ